MKQKQKIIIFAVIGIVLLLLWCAVIILVIKNLRGTNKDAVPPVVDVTLCDEDASNLCIVAFGANNLNRMVIHFQLPTPDYAPFYVKATNRGTVSVYTCEVDEVVTETATEAVTEAETEIAIETVTETAAEIATETVTETATEPVPTDAHCTGVRTPLGETIDIEVYTTDGDQLIGRGTFRILAIALPTPISLPTDPPAAEEIPTEELLTEEVPTEEVPIEEVPTEELSTEEIPTEEVPTSPPGN
jgi:hypothetical protein